MIFFLSYGQIEELLTEIQEHKQKITETTTAQIKTNSLLAEKVSRGIRCIKRIRGKGMKDIS